MSKCKQSREYARTYYWANVERLRAYHREWNRRHKDVIYPKQNAAKRKERREQHEKVLAREAEYRARPGVLERKRKQSKKWRKANRDEYLRRKREKRAANIEAAKVKERQAEARRKKRKQTDAAYYHKRLALSRIQHAKARLAKGKLYSPRFHLRFPEWATMGVFDPRSAFLAENITPEMRAYARELAIERRAAK